MKFIIDIRDSDLSEGCAMCPLNYDYISCNAYYCTDSHKNDDGDPLFGWLLDGNPNKMPDDCPLIPLIEEVAE